MRLLFFLAAVMIASTIEAQESRTVWSSVYTPAQAAAGRTSYEQSCTNCHGPDLAGRVGGSLKGDVFMRDWSGETLAALFTRIKTTMPRGAVGSLKDEEYLGIVTYILEVNEFPSSPTSELKIDGLSSIRVESKDGPGIVPNFALVETVGCLAQGPDKAWILTDATDLVRSREAGGPKEDVLKAAATQSLGKGQFKLLYIYPTPDALLGQKVHTKGLLIRDPKGDSINVTSLRGVAPECKAP
jgi:S-disulfanyl-L-cysteine oxidoreductase SoxD